MSTSESRETEIFKEIAACPRPSGSLSYIQGYLESFADRYGLVHSKDDIGNIMFQRPGASSKRVILQAHQDMVPTAAAGKKFDFWTQPISVSCDGGWLHADGTTLGADDGAGMAIALSAMISDELKDIDLRAVFTVDEETSMAGAIGMDPSWLDADYLINIDSEDENEAIIGCAGCAVLYCNTVPDNTDSDGRWFRASVSGLSGGHSGIDIDKGHANALLLMSEFLSTLHGLKISSFSGGSAPNVIPMSAEAVFTAEDPDVIRRFDEFAETVRDRYKSIEPGMFLDISVSAIPETSWTEDFSSGFIRTLLRCPNGCIEKTGDDIITSSNCAIVFDDGRSKVICVMLRSSKEQVLSEMADGTMNMFSGIGSAELISRYPAWSEDRDSFLVSRAVSVYKGIHGDAPKVTVTHGGLECGEFRKKNPRIQMVSVGPTILGAHTPLERMDIGSFQRAKELVFGLVKDIS